MADAISPQALSKLIGSIYDCTLDPDRWDRTLAEVMDAFEGRTAILHLTDLQHDRVLISKAVGIEPYMLQLLDKHSPEINAWYVERLGAMQSLDEPFLVSRHLPRARVEASPYFRECVTPYGIVDIMGYFLMHTPTRYSGFGCSRHEQQGIITSREIELGQLLLPHLRRAVTISNVLDARTIERARMAEALDALKCGVVLTNESAAILHANRSAEHMLHNGSPIQGARGVLSVKAPSAAKELRSAIKLAAQNEVQIGKTGLAIRITEPDVPPVFAHVLPMNGGDLRAWLEPATAAAVFIGAPDEQDAAETMATAFGLTPAETRVLASLLAGRTLAETASALDIAATTAKTHLENIFSKTGVSRQAELMLLATRVAAPARAVT
jgi:DNA-binding CsgD family transcriptional regulator/PAS domain-containing protein